MGWTMWGWRGACVCGSGLNLCSGWGSVWTRQVTKETCLWALKSGSSEFHSQLCRLLMVCPCTGALPATPLPLPLPSAYPHPHHAGLSSLTGPAFARVTHARPSPLSPGPPWAVLPRLHAALRARPFPHAPGGASPPRAPHSARVSPGRPGAACGRLLTSGSALRGCICLCFSS